MPEVWTKESCIQKYKECKCDKDGVVPEYREFLNYCGIPKLQLSRLFGPSAYSKLQTAAGDDPNKLELRRTPLHTIMNQYGSLVLELEGLPTSADWEHRGLKPSVDGLRKRPHKLKWTEMPARFLEWFESNPVSGFQQSIRLIKESIGREAVPRPHNDPKFARLIREIREWTPARRRNSEETYKVELRGHLKALEHNLNEEFGESKYDLLVGNKYAIEVKKDPDLCEYDRLFGQIARHLQHQRRVIVVILEATRGDRYDNFAALVDQYFDGGETSVEIIKK